ncbi:MAG: hypothetical protein COB33_001815 [Thiotrichaceae bacterium]|nr:hypothetical protein [Thiotrichaceae bacterium]
MQNDWLRENMLMILSIIGAAATACVGGIFVLYFLIKRKTKQKNAAK